MVVRKKVAKAKVRKKVAKVKSSSKRFFGVYAKRKDSNLLFYNARVFASSEEEALALFACDNPNYENPSIYAR